MAQFVGGRYQLIAQLGGGGMADVYLAKLSGKADFAKLAVVKRLKPIEDDDPEIIRMFADEARLCARLNHPSIVQTFEVGEDQTGPYLVMEYLEGQSLQRIRSRVARREAEIPRPIALQVLCDTIGALSYAHGLADHDGTLLKVVHRDVSPENIMVTYAGITKLVDFGVAKTTASINRTRAGVLKGKVAYMAPEQARSDTTIDARADVFAAGLVLWEVLTRQRLWEGRSEAQVFERLLDKEPLPRARSVDRTIPLDLDDICAKAIQKEKEDRFESAAALQEALERACAKYGYRASAREVGSFVAGLFEPEREKVRNLVSNSLKKHAPLPDGFLPPNPNRSFDRVIPPASPSDPVVAVPSQPELVPTKPMPPLPDGPAPFGETLPMAMSSVGAAVPAPVQTRFTVELPQKKDPARVGLVAGGIIAFALVGAALVAGARLLPRATAKPAPTVIVTVSAPPAPPAPPSPNVTVDITVRPAAGRIFVDGKPVAGNPHHLKTARTDASHEVRAEADGYESHTTVLAFDRDRTLDLALVKIVVSPAPLAARGKGGHGGGHPAAGGASEPRGISEMDVSKPKAKHDKIDTDVFGR